MVHHAKIMRNTGKFTTWFQRPGYISTFQRRAHLKTSTSPRDAIAIGSFVLGFDITTHAFTYRDLSHNNQVQMAVAQ
jgi:hypothetical protein